MAKFGAPQRQPVLGADTAVVLDDEILGKPRDEQDCLRMLTLCPAARTRCSPRWRCAASEGSRVAREVSEVTFRELADDEMRRYWRSGEPADKAGGYAVQGRAAVFIERIAGQLLRHHGTAAVRDRRAAGRASGARA